MEKGAVLFVLVILILAGAAAAQVFLGTVDGYIRYAANTTNISGANVTANVSGKLGSGAFRTALTDATGYFIITTLNMDEGDTVTVGANYSNFYNSSTAVANEFQIAQVNLSLPSVPSAPSLSAVNDTHNDTIIFFNWTNGSDSAGSVTYNRFTLDGVTFNNTNPVQNRTFLSYNTHAWSVVTCNANGCSPAATDGFEITNLAPPIPTIANQSDTNQTNVTLNWSASGSDPEGDTAYFQVRFDNHPLYHNITPPFNLSNLVYGHHTWGVRSCDGIKCSDFAVDEFNLTNRVPTIASLQDTTDNSLEENSFVFSAGEDPDGQSVSVDFQLNQTAIVSNAVSPYTVNVNNVVSNLSVRVRTCDTGGACSAFVTDSYIHYDCA